MNINKTMRRSTPQIRIMIVAPSPGSWNNGEKINKVCTLYTHPLIDDKGDQMSNFPQSDSHQVEILPHSKLL